MFGRFTHARKRSLARATVSASAAALLVGILPAQSLAVPPNPAQEEIGREETLALEPLDLDVPVEPAAPKPRLAQLRSDAIKRWRESAPTTITPPMGQGPANFDAPGTSPASARTAATAEQTGLTPVSGLPVKLGQAQGEPAPTGTWQVQMQSGTAVDGSLIVLQAPEAGAVPVSVNLDYSSFEYLYGADWATRLQFVQFPDCYLTTPDVEACQAYEELETANDPATNSLTAVVDPGADDTVTQTAARTPEPAGAGVFQAAYRTSTSATPVATGGGTAVIGTVDSGSASDKTSAGTFKATPLASDGKWEAGGSSGAFTWSYPLNIPKPPAGPAPSISFSYNSQSVDGRTAVASPQVSWIGEGWSYDPGYIERRYRTCQDDRKDQGAGLPNNTAAKDKTTDLCWVSYNAVLNMGGKTVELVRDTAGTDPERDTETYRTQLDDGSRIEHRVDGTNDDNNGEYWIVTQTDGTKYYFGLNSVGGGHAATNSVSTVPVFGNHSGEPCHATAFADSRCGTGTKQEAWRWSLDKVVDVNGNVMIVNWKQETNYYAVRKKFSTPEQYDRAAYPTTIEYGLRSNSLTQPSAMVVFDVKERCLSGATVCAPANFAKTDDPGAYRAWWDTPGNLNCKSDSDLCPAFPSFWTQYRLNSVTTKVLRSGDTIPSAVDTYTLQHEFPFDWYDTAPGLWLDSITRTGYAPGDTTGTKQSEEGISFGAYTVSGLAPPMLRDRGLLNQLPPNLVPSAAHPGRPGFTRPRIGTVSTENGGDIEVQYTGGCDAEPTLDKGENNGTCYPVRWSPDGDDKTPAKAWFNKYVVESVTEMDQITGRGKPIYTKYTYSDTAWAKSDDEFQRPALRTYSDWRGYRQVTVTKGSSTSSEQGDQNPQSLSVTRYFQGVGGEVKDSTNTHTLLADDAPQYAGMTAETLTYRDSLPVDDELPLVKQSLNFPWSKQTASRSRSNEDGTPATPLLAHRTGVRRSDEIQQVEGSTWRAVRTLTTVDDTYGLPVQVETAVVKPSGTSETLSSQTCTVTTYLHNTSAWLIGLPKEQRTTGTSCASHATADPATKLKSAMQQSYDGLAYNTPPTKGMVTSVAEINGAGTAYSHTTTTTYDALGRVLTVTKPGQGTTTTSYTPSSSGPVTQTLMTDAAGHTTTTTFEPGRGQPLTVKDPNDRITRYEYDALGRLAKGWSPSRSAGGKTPNVEIAYQTAIATPTENRPAAVTVKTLKDDGSYAKTITVYDGLARETQQQTEAHGPGRIVVDTTYDDHGLVWEKTNPYLAKGEPDTKLFRPKSNMLIPSSTKYRYDGLERKYRASVYHDGHYAYATYTEYELTSTYVNPAGSTAPRVRTYFDALGRVTSIKHYVQDATTSYNGRSTTYTYDARGNRSQVSDPAGNVWTYSYDARGRVTSATDPDAGTTTTLYDAADRPNQVENARGLKTFTEYDNLGRVLAVRQGSATAQPSQAFDYDDAPGGIGQPYESKRHTTDGDYIDRVNGYDADYNVTSRSTVIPSNFMTTGMSGAYTYTYTYTPTGKPQSVTLPARLEAGLAEEKVITRYTSDGLPESTSGLTWYTADVTYSPLGEPLRAVTGSQPNRLWTTNFIDPQTGRLERTVTDRETANPHRINDSYYSYDTSGLITSQATNFGGAAGPDAWDTQCYTYDVMGELVHAWTSNITPNKLGTGCKSANGTTWGHRSSNPKNSSGPVADAPNEKTDAAAPDTALASSLAAAAPYTGTLSTGATAYRQSFTFDWLGNRATMTEPDPANVTQNVTSTYEYGETVTGNGVSPSYTYQPHTMRKVLTDPMGKGGGVYDYDETGNTTERSINGTTQSLTWNHEGRLETAGALQTAAGPITGLGGKCLDVQGGQTADGTPIQLYTCNNSAGQQWERTGDVLKSLGKCATVNGSQVQLNTCSNGSETQKFVLRTGDKSLYNPSTGLCLDVPGANSADGTDLQLAACAGTTAQQWTPAGTTTYIYDTAGNRLLEHSDAGSVLYLGETELTTDAEGKITRATRAYAHSGAPTVVRSTSNGAQTGHKLNAMVADHLGTSNTTVELSGVQPVTRRSFKPYGDLRGPKPSAWPDKRSYLGVGIDDVASSLTHIGAREYDASTGRFISVDPIMDIADPIQMNGYAYANNSPISNSDPSGLMNTADLLGKPCKSSCFTYEDEGTSGLDFSGDGYITTFPTVNVPTNWNKAPKYIEIFNAQIRSRCTRLTLSECSDLMDPFNSSSVIASKGIACEAVGGSCPSGLDYEWGALVRAGVEGAMQYGLEGPKGGFGGPLPGKKRSKSRADADDDCHQCFLAGTQVLLADQTTKNIEEIKAGDEVLATDPETGETAARTVTDIIVTEYSVKRFNKLTIKTPAGDETLAATADHPFWVPRYGEWVPTSDIAPGMALRRPDGTTVTVTANRPFIKTAHTFNLTVDDLHTYYVLAGTTPVLVHNCNNLTADDARFPAAHVLDEHVNVSDQRLIQMAQTSGVKSRFTDLQTAQQVVDYGIASNKKRIGNWLRGGGVGPLEIKGRFGANSPIGVRADASGSITPTSNAYTIILQRAAGHPEGYYVSTAYPR
ncbi:ricin-type beta-trefoil lectin domain protein [Streptomyces sp. NPDC093094]|uniref:ricin-type beta-trefoil lectin domain protein n=1 Tax=Streptomyces sp. NPDC093094 TaxID=3366026 RepID=UPI0038299AD6